MTLTGTGFANGAKLTGPSGVTFMNVHVVNSTTIPATMKVLATTAADGNSLGVTVTKNANAGYGKAMGRLLDVRWSDCP